MNMNKEMGMGKEMEMGMGMGMGMGMEMGMGMGMGKEMGMGKPLNLREFYLNDLYICAFWIDSILEQMYCFEEDATDDDKNTETFADDNLFESHTYYNFQFDWIDSHLEHLYSHQEDTTFDNFNYYTFYTLSHSHTTFYDVENNTTHYTF